MSWGIGDRVGVAVGIGNIASFLSKSIQSRNPQPSLVLDFAGTGTLDSRVTFTRSTTGTYYNSSGILTTAAINQPRFDFNPTTGESLGLLIEEQRTNLVLNSKSIALGTWSTVSSGVTISANATTSLDGTVNASLIIPSATNNYHTIYQSVTATAAAYTFSAYFKANGYNFCGFREGGTGLWATFNLSTTTVVGTSAATTATITFVENGWYRCTMTYTATAGASNIFLFSINNSYVSGTPVGYSFTGNGTSGTYMYGVQFELGAFATSYIPTTSAQVTRAADTPPLPISTWYNTSQGTWFAQVNMLSTAGTPRIVGATPSSKAPILISSQAAAMFDSTTTIATANTITANTTQKIATAWTGTTGLVCLNGGTVATGSQATGYADLSTIGIGYNSTSNNNFINGRIASITYYPTTLTSAQLQALTT